MASKIEKEVTLRKFHYDLIGKSVLRVKTYYRDTNGRDRVVVKDVDLDNRTLGLIEAAERGLEDKIDHESAKG